nr:MAG TPA: hypothetical protein [Caudoviricetes sp.]
MNLKANHITNPTHKVLIIDLDQMTSAIDDEIPCWSEKEATQIANEQKELLEGTPFKVVALAFY